MTQERRERKGKLLKITRKEGREIATDSDKHEKQYRDQNRRMTPNTTLNSI